MTFATQDWEQLLGAQVRAARISADLDQVTLASRANVSVGAVKNLEAGRGSTLKTLVRVLRALDRADWLATLTPPPPISPLAVSAAVRRTAPRKRVSRRS